jgi:alcohol dehydrogenase class IV
MKKLQEGFIMQLMVYSNSTKKYIDDWNYNKSMLVTEHPTGKTLKIKDSTDKVIAIGGGSVIDTAKIISKTSIIAIPTTFSGASRTSHAVCWDKNKKINVVTEKPITIVKSEYFKSLPNELLRYTKADCLCHAVESIISKKSNKISLFLAETAIDLIKQGDWINASLLAGDAMEITSTNVIHALSYPLTSFYGVPHGKALAYLLPKVLDYLLPKNNLLWVVEENFTEIKLDFNIKTVIDEAFEYPKIHESRKKINKKILEELLK